MTWPFTRFEIDDHKRLNLLANTFKQPATQIIVDAVRLYAERTFGGRSVGRVLEEVKSGVALTSLREQDTDMESLVQAVEKLTAELGTIRQAIDETRSDIQWGVRNSQDYLSAIADATDEIRGEVQTFIRNQEEPRMNGKKRQSALF